MLELAAADYRLAIDPARGGSILRFDWRGEPLMRPACGPSILDVACFPLVPFSNRIADGRFAADGVDVRLKPNFPGSSHPHPLHGFGWLSDWAVRESAASSIMLEHSYEAAEWPWSYRARQCFILDETGLKVMLSLNNLSDAAMPAGLGLHPYFPRNAQTVYRGLHRGEWQNDAGCLPVRLDEHAEAVDWWHGTPVATRAVDTAYAHREGALTVSWPDRALELSIEPSANLAHTVVYSPPGADYFCAEPVSHATDAVNSRRDDNGLCWLDRGAALEAQVTFTAGQAR